MTRDDAEKWDGIYHSRDDVGEPSRWLADLEPRLCEQTSGRRAVDLAGGAGRHALFLATSGWDVELVDISAVALAMAQREAVSRGLSLTVRRADLDDADLGGPYDLGVIHHFCDRRLYRALEHIVLPGGLVAICHPTVTNLSRHTRPSRRWLLEVGELGELFAAPAWQRLDYDEGWFPCGRHEARLVARRLPR